MHTMVTFYRTFWEASALCIGCMPAIVPAQAPVPPARAALVAAIVTARAEVMRDTTPLEGCWVQRFLGGATDYLQSLDTTTARFVGPCGAGTSVAVMERRDVVILDSAFVDADTSKAYLSVFYGNLLYHQSMHFRLVAVSVNSSARPYWKLLSSRIGEMMEVRRRYGGIPK